MLPVAYTRRVSQWRIQDEHKLRECKHRGARLTTLPDWGTVNHLLVVIVVVLLLLLLLYVLMHAADHSLANRSISVCLCIRKSTVFSFYHFA